MDFVFKLSFFLHSVTNQNFKKNAKFLIINKPKIESKKKTIEKRVWMTSFFHATFSGLSALTHGAIAMNHAALFLLSPLFWSAVLCWDSSQSTTVIFLAAVGKLPSSSFFPLRNAVINAERVRAESQLLLCWEVHVVQFCLRSWNGVLSRRESDVIQTLYSIYFFSVCSKPKKDCDFSWMS